MWNKIQCIVSVNCLITCVSNNVWCLTSDLWNRRSCFLDAHCDCYKLHKLQVQIISAVVSVLSY